MVETRVLIANRGEVAVRVARAVDDLGWTSIGVFGADDADAGHLGHCHERFGLGGRGTEPYLHVETIVAAARRVGARLLHPGYGFLAERAELAEACAANGIVFVGPGPAALRRFGDKTAARSLAAAVGLPVLAGRPVQDHADVEAFLSELGPEGAAVLKAVAGGGGRGLRVVRAGADTARALERSRSEATTAFGVGDLYVEALVPRARHVEVQVIGDGSTVIAAGARECTLQRRHQKLVETAPSPSIGAPTRERLFAQAVALAEAADCQNLATIEFLIGDDAPTSAWFIEANARLQVEHTVSEAVHGLDLVQVQLQIATGASLADLGLADGVGEARGAAIQVRVNAESFARDGSTLPSSGVIERLALPSGPGVRCDTAAHEGMRIDPAFDSMLVKVIAHARDHDSARRRVRRALDELVIEGVATNRRTLQALLDHPEVIADRVTTDFVDTNAAELVAHLPDPTPGLDPRAPGSTAVGSQLVTAPIQGTVVSITVAEGDPVGAGQELLIMEAMKMEHVICSPCRGVVSSITVAEGAAVAERHPLIAVTPADVDTHEATATPPVDPDHIRPDLRETLDRHAVGEDEHRPEKVARRHARGDRTARENIVDLVDEGSFVEYGPLTIAAQRRRRSLEDLIENTPGDGLVGGIGTINGDRFAGHAGHAVVMSYDYMVLAGTQGLQNHRKKDRLFEIAERQHLPVVVFTEGGGGRPGDTDSPGGSGLDCLAFMYFAGLSGLVPLVGISNGPCFAGNAALLGCCDVVIATASSSIGMGGPAMIEGGGLGVYHPDEVGPLSTQVPNGVVDIAVADEAEAVSVAKRYLAYFQGDDPDWECADQRRLRHVIPENRLRTYEVGEVIETLFDIGSVLELRSGWGHGMVIALARIEGRAVGVIANNPTHLAGAIDAAAADKAARFMQLCDAHDLPIVMLCDTPGIMVGPEAEKEATVRHAARMFVTGASLDVPFMTVVLRKGYGLGAQAMAGASFKAGSFTISWPTGEFGGMGLEGFVKLGYRKELEAIEDPVERERRYEEMVAHMYDVGRAVATATTFEIDDVIDPADSRRWITTALRSSPPPPPRTAKKRPMIDTW